MNLLKKLLNYTWKSKKPSVEEENIEDVVCNKLNVIYNTINNNIVVTFKDGDVLEGIVTQDVYKEILNCCNKQTIVDLLQPKTEKSYNLYTEDLQEKSIVDAAYESLSVLPKEDFDVVNNNVYLKNIKSIFVPPIIVAEFVRINTDIYCVESTGFDCEEEYVAKEGLVKEYEALLAFTYKLLLNPLENSRNQLLTFVKKNDVKITNTGNLVLYRACLESNEEGENTELVKYVAKEYLKIKAWKKAPKNYKVVTPTGEKDYSLVGLSFDVTNTDLVCLGTLDFLYNELPKMQTNKKHYYSWHGKKKIVLGDIYSIPEDEINLDAGICAGGGTHAAAVDYDYSGFGNVNLVVLVNPSKALTVPYNDVGKIRVTEMFIVGINPNPLGVHINEDVFHDFDEQYHNYSIEELKNALQTKSLEGLSIQTEMNGLNLNEISCIENILSNRVINV